MALSGDESHLQSRLSYYCGYSPIVKERKEYDPKNLHAQRMDFVREELHPRWEAGLI